MRILFLAALALAATPPTKPVKVKPVKLPKGPGMELVQTKCSACHPLALVVAKPKTQDQWEATMDQMVSRGAKLTDPEYDLISAYLTKNFGPKK